MLEDAINTEEEVLPDELPEEEVVDLSAIGEVIPEENEKEKEAEWVTLLRRENRELKRANRDLSKPKEAPEKPKDSFDPLKKPTLADPTGNPDDAYDQDALDRAIDAWTDKKLAHEKEQQKKKAEEAEAQNEWNAKLTGYKKQKDELKASDMEDAEDKVEEVFTVAQQGYMLESVKKPALVVLALGRSPAMLKKLAEIKNPIKFAVELRDFEREVESKMKSAKNNPPPPESTPRGSGGSKVQNNTLDKLRAQAQKTGDYTKVTEYKRNMKK